MFEKDARKGKKTWLHLEPAERSQKSAKYLGCFVLLHNFLYPQEHWRVTYVLPLCTAEEPNGYGLSTNELLMRMLFILFCGSYVSNLINQSYHC